MLSASDAWGYTLGEIFNRGKLVEPRNQACFEIQDRQVTINMCSPVVGHKARKLNYSFMAAEAMWIISGSNRVEDIAPYNPNIAQFSDDGEVFAGAYGPPIAAQWAWVLEKLHEDRDTRQATLTIWERGPAPSKDIPCTVAMNFRIRNSLLNVSVFMRSSDVWLGLPYDLFNFSMLGTKLCCDFNLVYPSKTPITPGVLTVTAASMHLYHRDLNSTYELLYNSPVVNAVETLPIPQIIAGDWSFFYASLRACRDKVAVDPQLWKIRP